MATLVMIHGIAQERKSADRLEEEWLPDLAGGVRIAGYSNIADRLWHYRQLPAGIEARMAFYGHRFLKPGQQGAAPSPPTRSNDLSEHLARIWLERAASRSRDPRDESIARRELAYLTGDASDQTMGARSIARGAVKRLARVRWMAPMGMGFAEKFVARALSQVTSYLTDDALRSSVLKDVSRLIDERTSVLIGHSLGSVVAFEAAWRMRHYLPLLVTLGSPLGLESVVYQRLRPQPPQFPPMVRRWLNVADRNDLVAAEPDLRPMFGDVPRGATFDGSWTVDNGAEPHRVGFYLTRAEVGGPIAQALS